MDNKELILKKSEEILQLRGKLHNSDYKQSKFIDGDLTEAEYAPIREQRKAWRAEINALEAEIEALRNEMVAV